MHDTLAFETPVALAETRGIVLRATLVGVVPVELELCPSEGVEQLVGSALELGELRLHIA